jgi:hypothetical protein
MQAMVFVKLVMQGIKAQHICAAALCMAALQAGAQESAAVAAPAAHIAPLPALDLSRPLDATWSFMVSPNATYHYTRSEEHRPVRLVAVERVRDNGSVHGGAFFTNSFGQPTAYWYPYGKHYANLFGSRGWYAKYTAGLIYGYVGKYADKVPLNYNGFSPAIIPAIGYQPNKNYAVQLNVLGTAGLMLSFSSNLDF